MAQFSGNVAISIVQAGLFPKVWRLRHKLIEAESCGVCRDLLMKEQKKTLWNGIAGGSKNRSLGDR